MEQDYSWKALAKPGEATDYFNLPSPAPLQIGAPDFNITNAWWLAEISRLIYQADFRTNKGIKLGAFTYEKVNIINNKETCTYAALFNVIGINAKGEEQPCLVIAFRGTDDLINWNNNVRTFQTAFGESGKVHDGFKETYLSIREELLHYIADSAVPIFITGHSLGAALATLTSAELINNNYFDSCYTFGSPRVADPTFADTLNSNRIYRIINNCDIVTTIPLSIPSIEYQHIGLPLLLSNKGELFEGLDETAILDYQKEELLDFKGTNVLELFSNNIKNFKSNVPSVLADHAPINYVSALAYLFKKR